MSEKTESVDGMWNSQPSIGGLSTAEVVQVYAGDFNSIFERVKAMPVAERSQFMNKLEGDVGSAIHELVSMSDTHQDIEQHQKADEFQTNVDRLTAFLDQMRELHPGI